MMLKAIFCYFALFKHLFFAINDADALTLLGGGDVIHKDAEVVSACRQIGNVGALHGMADGLFHSEVFDGVRQKHKRASIFGAVVSSCS